MRAAIPFHLDLQEYYGEHALKAERELYVGSVFLGAFACKLVYDLSKQLSPHYFGATYTKLPKRARMEWDNRVFSTAHAIWCSFAAAYLVWISDVFRDETPLGPVVFRSTIFSYFVIAFSTGYFLADLAMILYTYPSLGGPDFVLHHFFTLGSVMLASYYAHAHLYILMVFCTEISTPLINLRWYLMTAGMKESKWYLYNGITLLVVWLFARVLLFVYFFYHIYLHYDQVAQFDAPGFYFLFTAPPGLAIMNLFWFYKICMGAARAVFRNKRD